MIPGDFTRTDGSMPMNLDQARFKQLCLDAIRVLCKKNPHVTMIGYDGPGKYYQDYVVTIIASRDGENCEVYRNRDGEMVFSMRNMRMTGFSYKFIFVENHLSKKVAEHNG